MEWLDDGAMKYKHLKAVLTVIVMEIFAIDPCTWTTLSYPGVHPIR